MAARSPTSYTVTPYKYLPQPQDQIITTHHSEAVDDLHLAISRSEILLSSCMMFNFFTISSSRVVFDRFYVRGRNLCGTAAGATENVTAYFLCKGDDTPTDYTIEVYDGNAAAWLAWTVTTDLSDLKWRGGAPDAGNLTATTDGTENEYRVAMKVTSGQVTMLSMIIVSA